MQDPTSLSLLDRLRTTTHQGGTTLGWDNFAELYTPLVYSWCRQQNLQPSVVSEIVQEVFLAVYQNYDRFRKDKPGDSFRGWMWSITRNKIRDHWRTIGENPPPLTGGSTVQAMIAGAPEEEPATMTSLNVNRKNSLLANALLIVQSEFETKTWDAFWKTKIEKIPTADVAEELGMTSGAIRKARFRILKRLREELGEVT